MKKLFIIILFVQFFSTALRAEGNQYPNVKLFGVLRSQYQVSTETGNQRFAVANARLGATGGITEYLDYMSQIEYSLNGKFVVLDLNGTIKPTDWLSITFGQQVLPIYNLYTVVHKQLLFSNMLFLADYLCPTRDLGAVAKVNLVKGDFPVTLYAGVLNGGSINNPVWDKKVSYTAKIELGAMTGFRTSAKMYRYAPVEAQDYLILGADLRYENQDFKVETEAFNRHNYFDGDDMFTSYIQGGYNLPLKDGKIFHSVIPALRWENMSHDILENGMGVNRFTVGLGFTMEQKLFSSILRVDYDLLQGGDDLPEFAADPELNNSKFTVELVIAF